MDVLNFLIENGANLNRRDNEGKNCFDMIVENSDDKDLLECVFPMTKSIKRDLKQPGQLQLIHYAAQN